MSEGALLASMRSELAWLELALSSIRYSELAPPSDLESMDGQASWCHVISLLSVSVSSRLV